MWRVRRASHFLYFPGANLHRVGFSNLTPTLSHLSRTYFNLIYLSHSHFNATSAERPDYKKIVFAMLENKFVAYWTRACNWKSHVERKPEIDNRVAHGKIYNDARRATSLNLTLIMQRVSRNRTPESFMQPFLMPFIARAHHLICRLCGSS